MIKDDHWHEGVVLQHDDGSFFIYEDLNEAQSHPIKPLSPQCKYQEVKYTWNKGQPIVDFGDFKMAVVDINQ